MSTRNRPDMFQSARSSVASRTAFEALQVDEGESSEEEVVFEPAGHIVDGTSSDHASESSGIVEVPAKPSKTAQKRAARAARQQSNASKADPKTNGMAVADKNGSQASSSAPNGSKQNPVEVLADVPLENSLKYLSSMTPTINEPVLNGHVLHPEVPVVPQLSERSPLDPSQRHAEIQPKLPAPFLPDDLEKASDSQTRAVETFNHNDPVREKQDVADVEKDQKRQKFFTRTLWTLIMISGFLFCLTMGHSFMILLVMVCQTLVYREVTALSALGVSKADDDERKGRDPWSKTLNWYFFAVANYFLYGENLIYYFKHIVFADAQFMPFAQNHRFLSFTLYIIGFVGFVSSLQKQYVTSQFRMFAWVHMSIMAIVMSSHFIIKNIFEGLIWFWVPASLVICNDVFAYIWGITLGRTPLFALSPKKTVEGFVGAAISTVIFGLFWGTFFMQFDYMICPAQNLGINAFSNIHCEPNHVFVWRELHLWAPLRIVLSTLLQRNVATIPYAPYQIHVLVMSSFASLVAPFGGFFASGFKRAFNVKDFGHSIPGHGGMTDRMDCQFLMGMFTWVYYSSLVKEHHVSVGQVLQLAVSSLSLEGQIELMHDLRRYLEGRGIAT